MHPVNILCQYQGSGMDGTPGGSAINLAMVENLLS